MRKHLIYLTNTELTARISEGGMLSERHRFNNDKTGWHMLANYLSHYVDVPIFLLRLFICHIWKYWNPTAKMTNIKKGTAASHEEWTLKGFKERFIPNARTWP